MKIHAGQVGFPGGKSEEGDLSIMDTAIRETTEEIGLPAGVISVLGKLTPLYVSVSNFIIHPYVAWTDNKPDFPVNHREVDKVMFFPLLRHAEHASFGHTFLDTVSGKLNVPGIPFDGEFIWGATAMILNEILDVLRPALINQE